MKLKNYKSGLDRGASRFKECLWVFCRPLFFAHAIPLPSTFLCMILRMFGASIGSGVVIRSGLNLKFPWRLTVGNDVWIGEDVEILNLANVTIGSDCCISQRAFLCTGSHRFDKPGFDLITKPITIRDGSWVAAMVFIAPGVTVGPNSMCVAGSVVLRDVAPDTIVLGNPAVAKLSRSSERVE